MRRLLGVATGGLVLALVFAAGIWAGGTALRPPSDPLITAEAVTFQVRQGTVSRELTLSAVASWAVAGTLKSGYAGIVTSVDAPSGEPVVDGQRIASVNLAPVFLAQGKTPAFRSLATGVRGDDVAALQDFLARQGYDVGTVDGVFSTGTTAAVRAWQTDSEQAVTGTIEFGTLLFTPSLPVRVRPVLVEGDAVSQAEPLVELLTLAPTFEMGVTDVQLGLIPPDAAVSVQNDSGVWQAQVSGVDNSEPGATALILAGTDGGAVCGSDCDAVPTDASSVWGATVTLVPRVEGLVIPVSGLRTDPDGGTSVLVAGGEPATVRVVASASGLAVIEGVPEGTVIELPDPDR